MSHLILQQMWMSIKNPFLFILIFSIILLSFTCSNDTSESKNTNDTNLQDSVFRFGFWNLENLFDTKNDEWNDDDFTPNGANKWNKERYQNKLNNLSKVISAMNADALGVCEVENNEVLKNLINTKELKIHGYGMVHYDSPDERGIDVAFLYKTNKIIIINSKPIKVELAENDKTRDILYIQLKLIQTGDTLHYFVNHWPSRREGKKESSQKRVIAAITLKQYIFDNGLQNKSLIISGDFNDNPWDSSVKVVLNTCRPGKNASCNLLNLTALLDVKEGGTLKFGKKWDLFDQLILGKNLWTYQNNNHLKFKQYSLKIFAPDWMKQHGGKFEGSPLRTFGGKNYLNGYSDHFPILGELKYE